MNHEAFATKALNFAATLCIGVFFALNLIFILPEYVIPRVVRPFDFSLATLPFKVLFSFTGILAALSLIASKLSSHFLAEHGQRAWKQISIATIALIAVFFIGLGPVQEPSQWWLYAVGVLTITITVLALSAALLAIGPIVIRFLSSIIMLGALVFAGGVIFLGFSNYSSADQTLKRGNIDTPQKALRALDSISGSAAMELGTNGFQVVERECGNSNIMCVADVQLYEISKIKRALGLVEADWNQPSASDLNDPNLDVYQVQDNNLSIVLAQGYGSTYITVANLAEIDESEWSNLNFRGPTLEN